jgi:hypothetical protein
LGWFLGIISPELYSKDSTIKRFIVKSLLFFYLLSSYLHAVHIHSSHEAHGENCKVCVVAKTFKSADIPSSPVEILQTSFRQTYVSTLRPAVITAPDKGYFSTAPPSV